MRRPFVGFEPFRWVGVAALAVGLAIAASGWVRFWILAYTAGVAVVFHLFVVLYEERSLHRRFGPEYEAYRMRVNRWIPHAR
jgi:protein-S-isoprenylcysteine O-methyltransferase Ste14